MTLGSTQVLIDAVGQNIGAGFVSDHAINSHREMLLRFTSTAFRSRVISTWFRKQGKFVYVTLRYSSTSSLASLISTHN